MDIHRPDLKQRAQRRRIFYFAAAAIAVVLAGWAAASLEPAAPGVARSSLWLDSVKRGDMLREVRGPGILVPREIRWIAAETNARVERIVVKPGAQVQADTVILELSNPEVIDQQLGAEAALKAAEADYQAHRMTLESQLLDQRANLAGVTSDYESARLQAEAERDLAASGIIPRIQARRSELATEQLKLRTGIERERIAKFEQTIAAQLAADRARMDQLRNAAELRRRQADGLHLKAGIAGVLQQVPVQEGQQVTAGSNLARVAKPGDLMAELRIPETQVRDVAFGQSVRVDTRNGIVAGKVIRIDPAVLNGSVQVDVELSGEMPAGARPDLSVDGTIEIERLSDVLYVGRPAYGQPESEVRLFRLEADSDRALRIPVKLGRASVSQIEIAGGLSAGDQIILSDTSQWDAYDRLKIE
ncbi:MAG: HlyD family efflux transporter periplasmic adaptor subunit [Xanthomonadaceae bacterium]|nr:HlyD family efflux transporter periplasmic adaptor subunit [Xanthomonadaceae bacterium]MDP2183949.1 HlyD family efflux transporter periplasmic adaptor subunit [Xanthomonadales bacterium]MDZ4116516.1 HlyD family efflux transporter periplasmic adaptor subunit [Xanthomonadaceae bacterium]MDZ4378736.1 HlyD family efflux transporter periplasmic adaptor subunit [Xanthomonadaceae bacterium]